jgi:hypothetical protein
VKSWFAAVFVLFSLPAVADAPPTSTPQAFVGEIRAVAFESGDPAFKALEQNGWLECDGRAINVSDYPDLLRRSAIDGARRKLA